MPVIFNTLSIVLLLFGSAFLIRGLIYVYSPPKNIEDLQGFEPKNKKLNPKRYDKAYANKLSIQVSLVMISLGILSTVFNMDTVSGIIVGILIVIILRGFVFFRIIKSVKNSH